MGFSLPAHTWLVFALAGTGGMGVPGNGLHVRTQGDPDMHPLACLAGLFIHSVYLLRTQTHMHGHVATLKLDTAVKGNVAHRSAF